MLRLTIRSWVVGRGNVLGYSQTSAGFFGELGCEMCIPIAYDFCGQTKMLEHVVEIEAGYALCGDCHGRVHSLGFSVIWPKSLI